MSGIELARPVAAALARSSGGAVDTILLYGSHLSGASPGRHSAVDFVVIVPEYRPFYEGLAASGHSTRPPWLMAAMARILPPNVIAYLPEDGDGVIAKCLVVSKDDFDRGLGPDRADHFLVARMVQRVEPVWSKGEEATAWVEARLHGVRMAVLGWLAPYLDPTFDAEAVGRRILEVCYRGELRPEAGNRAEVIFALQREHFRQHMGQALEEAADRGEVQRRGGSYALAKAPTRSRRWGMRFYFLRSKVRVTARWLKHMATFENWLPYVVRKVERRSGRKVELTVLERRLPLLFLWPRAIWVLLSRPTREDDS